MTDPISQVPSGLAPLSPAQVMRVRQGIAKVVGQAIPHAQEVLEGKRTWTPVQVQLFKALLSKVVPDISASYVEVNDLSTKRINGLTREELEAIASSSALDVSPTDNHETPGKLRVSADCDPEHSPHARAVEARKKPVTPPEVYERMAKARAAKRVQPRTPGGTPAPADDPRASATSPSPSGSETTNESLSHIGDTGSCPTS